MWNSRLHEHGGNNQLDSFLLLEFQVKNFCSQLVHAFTFLVTINQTNRFYLLFRFLHHMTKKAQVCKCLKKSLMLCQHIPKLFLPFSEETQNIIILIA